MANNKFNARHGLSVGSTPTDVIDDTGAVLTNAASSSKLQTARTISLSGDVVGSVSFDGSANATIATTIQPNSVALGTDTTGNYMVNVAGGTGVSVSHTQGEGSTATVSIGQPVGTTDNVTFNSVTVNGTLTSDDITSTNISIAGNATITGNLTVNGSTTTINSTTMSSDDVILTLGGDTAPTVDDVKDKGIEFRWYDTQARTGFFGFDRSTGKFTFIPQATNTSEVFSGTKGTIDANLEWADVLNKPTIGNGALTISAGDGLTLTGSGTFTANQTANNSITISHADTSSVLNVSSNNTGNTFIQDISLTFDTYGHVTGATIDTGTVSVGDGIFTVSAGPGLTGGGQLGTANQSGDSSVTISLPAISIAGTYTKVITDVYGRITTGTTLSSSDLPTYTGTLISSQITNALGFTPYNSTNPNGYITSSASITGSAATLTTARTIGMTGDVTWTSAAFNGSANVTGTSTLASVGTAGTYTKVTTDAKGRVTSGTTLSVADIPELTMAKLPGAAYKQSVKAATTANITLSGTQTIDGIALVAGDRVLVKNQTTASQNGIYIVSASTWTRALDADASDEIGAAVVNVDAGTANGGELWTTTFKTTDTLGTTAMNWYEVLYNTGTWGINISGSSASTTGNAATATALQTARTINGVSFNGTANITIADSTKLPLSGGTIAGLLTVQNSTGTSYNENIRLPRANSGYTSIALASDSAASSGQIAGQFTVLVYPTATNSGDFAIRANTTDAIRVTTAGAVNMPVSLSVAGNVALHAGNYTSYSPSLAGSGASGTWGISISGNAATATALQTARTINGVSFNGTANITVADSTKLPLSGGTLTGAFSAPYIGVNNTTNTNGYGISLYNGAVAGEPTYGIMFQGTGTFGTHGGVSNANDWATYFTMNNDNGRGWIFRKAGTGNTASISAGGRGTFDDSVRSPIFYDNNNTAYYADPSSTSRLNVTLTDYRRRPDHHLGHLEGSYNNVGANDGRSNPIYTIGSSYNPTATSLSNMYGIGYSHSNFYGNNGGATGWGLYVCAAGAYSAIIAHDGAWFRQNVTAYSDIRVKTNISRIENAVHKVKQLNGYTYDRLDNPNGKRQTGVIAQEVLEVLPEAVAGTEENHYSVAYGNMVGLLIEAIKEQQSEIDELKALVKQLLAK